MRIFDSVANMHVLFYLEKYVEGLAPLIVPLFSFLHLPGNMAVDADNGSSGSSTRASPRLYH
jgi:hypothetical protein